MMRLKVLSIFGTRPEAIKLAPVIKQLEKTPDHIISRICVTAQHRSMLDQVLNFFNIKTDFDLNLMKNNQTPTALAASLLSKLEPILVKEKPDWVLVQGDTTTVAAASIAAFYAKAKVGHVEAGLRSFDKYNPFPEEINRRIAGVVADLHFAPTERARQNLLREGVTDKSIYKTGNTVIDALRWSMSLPYEPPKNLAKIFSSNKNIILVTAHRRENFGEPLKQICLALRDIANAFDGKVQIVYPVHLNPNVFDMAHSILENVRGVELIKPLDYLTLVNLMKKSKLILTDSGGIQEEAPGLGKPVLVLRKTTERPEAVEAGIAKIVGTNRDDIVKWTKKLLNDPVEYNKMSTAVNPYGDGHAAERIVDIIKNFSGFE